MTKRITYYDPKTKQTLTKDIEGEWQPLAFVDKIRREGKYVRRVEPLEPTPEPPEPEPAA